MKDYAYFGNVALEQEKKARRLPGGAGKRKKAKRTVPLREKMLYLVSVILVVSLSAFILTRYAQISHYNYQIQQMDAKISQLHEENARLRLEIGELRNRERILKIAQEKLGMIPAKENTLQVGSVKAEENR
ncbi:hypothetical protein BSNK01_15050 [Bacillaceae bacterium]